MTQQISPPKSQARPSLTWHEVEGSQITQRLKVDPEAGLTAQEAQARLRRYGANELKGKKGKHPVVLFLLQFNQPLLYILLIAGVIKALLGSWVNAGVIWGVTVINAIIGFVQESKAESAIAALASSVTTDAMVRRNGQQVQVSSRDLVPGDIVLLTSGDKCPPDLRLLRGRTLQINESSLTGRICRRRKAARPGNSARRHPPWPSATTWPTRAALLPLARAKALWSKPASTPKPGESQS
jgi:Ca2+-transporting ATPase